MSKNHLTQPSSQVNDLDQFGSTPLILAAQRDWSQVVRDLLQRSGVDPNHQKLVDEFWVCLFLFICYIPHMVFIFVSFVPP